MITTNRKLPFTTPMDPLHDEASGIANADLATRRATGLRDMTNIFILGMVIGTVLTTAVFILSAVLTLK